MLGLDDHATAPVHVDVHECDAVGLGKGSQAGIDVGSERHDGAEAQLRQKGIVLRVQCDWHNVAIVATM